MDDFTGEIHPLADIYPMLSEPDLRRLAEDIKANGLHVPPTLDREGRLIAGRNRVAACLMVNVEPDFEVYEGDVADSVLAENDLRRHQSSGQRAIARARVLDAAGRRTRGANGESGRWGRGSVQVDDESRLAGWTKAMERAGLVIDYAFELAARILDDDDPLTLDAAYTDARKARESAKRRRDLPDDLGALVDAGTLTLDEAVRRMALSPDYQHRVASGHLTLDEAEVLDKRDQREHREAVERDANRIRNFLNGYDAAASLHRHPHRDQVLACLEPLDQERIATIERSQAWQSTQK